MRGGDRLMEECSWMSGICPSFFHSTGKSETFSYRYPSSVFFANRFRSADWQKIQLPLGGSQEGENHTLPAFTQPLNPVSFLAGEPPLPVGTSRIARKGRRLGRPFLGTIQLVNGLIIGIHNVVTAVAAVALLLGLLGLTLCAGLLI